jgi:phosphoribosylaminoimidazolecarboxamide formyltransferase/IMP cyclohydrolase
LVVNLYPFEATVAKGAGYDDCIENIDIGGPAMIRAAAKNHGDVAVVVEPEDYPALLAELSANSGSTTLGLRKKLAAKAYARTASYDAAISNWFAKELDDPAPSFRAFGGKLAEALRYGENPHQSAAFYRTPEQRRASPPRGRCRASSSPTTTSTTPTRPMSASPVRSQPHRAVAIIKHANPAAWRRPAISSKPIARHWPAINLGVRRHRYAEPHARRQAARAITEIFTEVIIAPTPATRRSDRRHEENLRLLSPAACPDPRAYGLTVKSVAGGLLNAVARQCRDRRMQLKAVTKRTPTAAELDDRFAFRVAKHVKSNTIVYAKDQRHGRHRRQPGLSASMRRASRRGRPKTPRRNSNWPRRSPRVRWLLPTRSSRLPTVCWWRSRPAPPR